MMCNGKPTGTGNEIIGDDILRAEIAVEDGEVQGICLCGALTGGVFRTYYGKRTVTPVAEALYDIGYRLQELLETPREPQEPDPDNTVNDADEARYAYLDGIGALP